MVHDSSTIEGCSENAWLRNSTSHLCAFDGLLLLATLGQKCQQQNTSSDERDQDSALRGLPDSIWDWWERLNRVTHTPDRSGLITSTAP